MAPTPTRTNISTGGPWEDINGYSRAVRTDLPAAAIIHIAGSTAVQPDGSIKGENDPAAQTRATLETIEHALKQAGAHMTDIVRTRMYITDASHAEAVGRTHGEIFKDIKPAATLVVVKALVDPRMLVEIEAEAICR